jgi:hypothetical protein
MPGISKQAVTENVFDVIFETGLFSPRSGITGNHRFKQDYGLEGNGAIAAFTSRINGRFKPFGATISTAEMAGCARVSNLITLIHGRANTLVESVPAKMKGMLAKRKTAGKKKAAAKRKPS